MTIERYGTPTSGGHPFAKAAGAEGWLYVSGQVPRGEDGQIVSGNMTVQAMLMSDIRVEIDCIAYKAPASKG